MKDDKTSRDDRTVEDEGEPTEVTRREGATERRRPDKPSEHLAKGSLVGRYIVLDVLGEGGMGVVYNGFDPELDRKVAIKLLQAKIGGSSGSDQAWLLREAQALARLSHPNVVAVHDVGTFTGDRVFVAMELVPGRTLRHWLKGTPRTWREIVDVMRDAGAGLAAAHRAHLVHRDFKPDNVIVGDDGRVRVMDFGLARLRADEDTGPVASRSSDLQIDTRSPLTQELTIAGTVVGTPAYMAPELYKGAGADARSDQFAFGVALYEALFRARPYSKEELKAPDPVKPRQPDDNTVPAAIQRVVMKAIMLAPGDRYVSMDELLSELAVDPGAKRRRYVIGGTVLLAAAAIATGSAVVSRTAATPEAPCKGIEHRLDGVWDPAIKKTVQAAYEATRRPFAKQAFAGVERALDGYTTGWVHDATESCQATRIRRDQTDAVFALRQTCLDEKLAELRALTEILAHADKQLVDRGDAFAWELEPIAACANIAALKAPGDPPAADRARVSELGLQLAVVKAQLIAAQYLPALVGAQKVYDEAAKLPWEPTMAVSLAMRGGALTMTGNIDEAIVAYRDATWSAVRGKRDDIAADSALTCALMMSEAKKKPDEARVWLGLADALSKRGGVERALAIKRLSVEGLIFDAAGDLAAGVAAQEKAFAEAERQLGHDDPQMMPLELTFAGTLMRVSAWGKAAVHLEHALQLREQTAGKDHPDIALMLSDLGACYRHSRQFEKARVAFERSLAIREAFYGKNSPLLIATLDNYGEYLREVGDMTAALASMERARKLAFVVPGPTSEMYHQLLTDYADTYVAAGRLADARKMFDDAFALEDQARSTIAPITQTSRAELALVEHAWTDAAALAIKAVVAFEANGGKDNPALWRPLTALAKAKLGQGHPAEARPLLVRAIAIGDKAQVDAAELAPARTALTTLPK